MIGVTSYVGFCRVCEHRERERITAALLAYRGAKGALAVSKEYPDLTYRDVKMHERQCVTRSTVAAPGMDKADNERSNRHDQTNRTPARETP